MILVQKFQISLLKLLTDNGPVIFCQGNQMTLTSRITQGEYFEFITIPNGTTATKNKFFFNFFHSKPSGTKLDLVIK